MQSMSHFQKHFNPLFPYGKRPVLFDLLLILVTFQSTLPIREETKGLEELGETSDFNPLFPYGKRRVPAWGREFIRVFQSTLPIREETGPSRKKEPKRKFQSTLPIREETRDQDQYCAGWHFNPLFPYGKRRRWAFLWILRRKFQSTLPIREETTVTKRSPAARLISIHSSHTGRDGLRRRKIHGRGISIHSSHTGRDRLRQRCKVLGHISIHSSHTGRDPRS